MSTRMTKWPGNKRIGTVVLYLTAAAATQAYAQGDPLRAFDPSTAAARAPGTTMRIDLIGDSTQTNNAGYGRGFCANLTPQVDCVNMAKGGASTKTFREQGLWERSLQTKPDYMLIQFGHNDLESKDHLPRQTTMAEYEANLRRYVEEARAAGIKPMLVTPLTRRYFEADGKIHSDLTAHAETMKRVAAEMKLPLIDLHHDSIAYLDRIGEKAGNTLAITKKDDDGKTIFDKTHLDWEGSYIFGRIVAVDMGNAVPALAKYVKPEPAPLPPEGVKAMKIIEGGPVKIVLVGDSTVNAEGGWGKGFCAIMTPNVTCINEALNGRSSKSFIDEGAWKKALDDHGDYYLIQFGHNDMKGKGPERETDPDTTYAANIRRYIRDARAIGAIPVVVTSLSRRNYKNGALVQDLTDYAAAAKRVGMEENVTVIDLNAMSVKLLGGMTQDQADQFNATGHEDQRAENKKSPVDRTHLNAKGQALFGRMVADTLVRTQVELGPDIIGEPTKSTPTAK
jgi:lysophospholipase L1-like esterase